MKIFRLLLCIVNISIAPENWPRVHVAVYISEITKMEIVAEFKVIIPEFIIKLVKW